MKTPQEEKKEYVYYCPDLDILTIMESDDFLYAFQPWDFTSYEVIYIGEL